MNEITQSGWESLLLEEVILDVDAPYVYLGKLVAIGEKSVTLQDADAHDLRDTNTTREKYLLDAKLHGVSPNRKQVIVSSSRLVGMSRLKDLIAE